VVLAAVTGQRAPSKVFDASTHHRHFTSLHIFRWKPTHHTQALDFWNHPGSYLEVETTKRHLHPDHVLNNLPHFFLDAPHTR
jgi:hypothetical protein